MNCTFDFYAFDAFYNYFYKSVSIIVSILILEINRLFKHYLAFSPSFGVRFKKGNIGILFAKVCIYIGIFKTSKQILPSIKYLVCSLRRTKEKTLPKAQRTEG